MKLIVSIILCLIGLPAIAQKISDLPETTVISNSYLFILAKPGVANYKFTYANLVAALESDLNITTLSNAYVLDMYGRGTNVTLSGNTTNIGNVFVVAGSISISNTAPQLFLDSYSTTASLSGQIVNSRYRGTEAAPTAIQSGDVMATWQAYGYGSTVSRQGVILEAKAYGAFSDVSVPAMLNIRVGRINSGTSQNPVFSATATWMTNNANLVVSSNMMYLPGAGTAGHVLTALDTSGTVGWAVAGGGGGGTVFSNKGVFYVSTTGNNTTAKQGEMALPWRDPMAAQIAAAAAGGGLVEVFPGLYTTNNLGTNLVNFYLHPGVIISYIDDSTGAGKAIFDDRGKGAVTTKIMGAGDLRYSTGLTGYNVGTINITANPPNVNSLRGAICVTNALSDFNVTLSSITVTTLVGTLLVSGIYISDCSNVVVHCPRILDGIIGQQFYIGDDDAMSPVFGTSGMTGVYWEKGQTEIVSERIQGTGYAIYAFEPPANASTQHLHVTSHTIESFGAALTVYLLGSSNGFKVWITAHEIVARAPNAGTIGAYREGRYYITAQKISSPTIALFSADGDQQTWITSQRVAAGGTWAVVEGGKMDCLVGEWDDDGGLSTGWDVSRGELIVHDGEADVSNGRGLKVTAVGKAFFRDMHIDTHLGNLMTNAPVFVSTNGVILQNCVLVAPTAAPAIMAVGAQSVVSYGIYANKTNHPNITVQAGAFVNDANVR